MTGVLVMPTWPVMLEQAPGSRLVGTDVSPAGRMLWELMTPPGRVISKRTLSDKLSGFDEALGSNALEAFISRLRKKLAGSGASIRTLRGLGYVLEPITGEDLEPAA